MLPVENDDSVQPSSSDPVQPPNLTKMTKKEIELIMLLTFEQARVDKLGKWYIRFRRFRVMEVVDKFRSELPLMVIKIVNQEIKPVVEGLLRKVVKEELHKLTFEGNRNVELEEKFLHLKFLDKVSGLVQTSKEFKGINDGPLEVALLDESENIVQTGPASSAEVEIVLIDASGNDNENDTINENFERRIIKAGDKEKPHFVKNVYINLKEGKGSLINQKLGQDKDWTRTCTCRLGARLVKDIRGVKVQKAWTDPFEVKDNRGQLYKKHETLSLGDDVWRIKGISRDGKPRERLYKENIEKVKDFLFWLSVNPKKLQKILDSAGGWKAAVDHARSCKIDDQMIYCHKSSTEPEMGVIYDSVGELKGLIDQYHFVPIDNLSADEKVHARKLLSSVLESPSAFVDRYQTCFSDEASLVQQYPYKSSGVNAPTNCPIQNCMNDTNSEYINRYQTEEPGCSSQSISPTNISDSLGPMQANELCNDTLAPIRGHENIDGGTRTFLDDEIQTSMEVDACEPLENMNLLDVYMDLSDDESAHNPDLVQKFFNEFRLLIPDASKQSMEADACEPSENMKPLDVQMDLFLSGHEFVDNPDSGQKVVNPASKRWKQLFYVLTWKISINRRVSPNDTHPSRKRRILG